MEQVQESGRHYRVRRLLAPLSLMLMIGLTGCSGGSPSQTNTTYSGPEQGEDAPPGANGADPGESDTPAVSAGGHQTADSNVLLTFAGEARVAEGATIEQVTWTQIEGPTVQLLTPDQLSTDVLVPDVTARAHLRFQLVVVDDQGRTGSDITTLIVEPLKTFIRVVGGVTQENASTVEFSLRLNQSSRVPVTVSYTTEDGTALAGKDYNPANSTLTIPPGQLDAKIPIVLLDDSEIDGDKSFSLKITGVENGEAAAASGTMIILDDDQAPPAPEKPRLSVTNVQASEDAGNVYFTIELDKASTQPITVSYETRDGTASAGLDFTATSGSTTIAPGNLFATVAVTLLDDGFDEADETFSLAITQAEYADAPQTPGIATILDNDLPFAFAFNDITDAVLGAEAISEPITIAGLMEPASIRITGGEYSIDDGDFTNLPGIVRNGQQVRIRLITPSKVNTAMDVVLTIGNVSDTFSVTTGRPEIASLSFADPAFEACVRETADANQWQYVDQVRRLSCNSRGIMNAQEIGQFPSLTFLGLDGNSLTNIDLSANTALTDLWLWSNQLTSIDLTANTALTDLGLGNNQLTSIDLTANTALTYLSLGNNQLTSIDLTTNTALTDLGLSDNQLTSIDLSANTALEYIILSNNELTSIDLSANTALTEMWLAGNQLVSIDLTANTALTTLYLYVNELVDIDLPASDSLTSIDLSDNKLTSINLSENTSLSSVVLSRNQLESIALPTNGQLASLYLENNQLKLIDLSAHTSLRGLLLTDNQLESIALPTNSQLEHLYLNNNQLKLIDLSASPNLLLLYLDNNQLTSIDLTANTALTDLDLYNNQLTSIDLDNNNLLNRAWLQGNPFDPATISYLEGLKSTIEDLQF